MPCFLYTATVMLLMTTPLTQILFQENRVKLAPEVTILDFNKEGNDWVAVSSAGTYASYLFLLQTDNHTSTNSLDFYRLGALKK